MQGSEDQFLTERSVRSTSVLFAGFVCLCLVMMGVFRDSAQLKGEAMWFTLLLLVFLAALAWTDFRRFLLPDILTLPLIVLGLVASYRLGSDIVSSLSGTVLGYALIAGLAHYWRRRFGREGIGLGDAKLLAAGGAWLGAFDLALILLIGSGLSLAFLLGLSMLKRTSVYQQYIPFGPALSVAIWGLWLSRFSVV